MPPAFMTTEAFVNKYRLAALKFRRVVHTLWSGGGLGLGKEKEQLQ